jgi:hypothetical protein
MKDKEDPDRLKIVEDQARCECEHCQAPIHDHHKPEMLKAGYWKADRPESRRKKIGYLRGDFGKLVKLGLVEKLGAGRSTRYRLSGLGESLNDREADLLNRKPQGQDNNK